MPLPDRVPSLQPLAASDRPIPFVPGTAAFGPQRPQPTLADTLRKLWRHRGFVLAGTLGFAILSVAIADMIPATYMSESQVLVGGDNAPKLFKDLEQSTAPAALATSDDRVQSERYVVLSGLVAQKVVQKLNLTQDPEFNAALRPHHWSIADLLGILPASWLASNSGGAKPTGDRTLDRTVATLISKVDVSVMGRSNVLSIDAHSRNPDKAALIANTIADVYLDQQRNSKIADSGRVESYMQDRIADLRKQVETAEQAVEDYRREYKLYIGETSGVANQQLTEMNTQLTAAQTAKAEADAKLAEAMAVQKEGLQGDSVPAVLASPLIIALKQQESEAERHLAELSANYGDKHPDVINARAQIRDIQRKIRTEIGGTIAGIQHEARTADAHYATLSRDFAQTQHQMGGVNEKTIHLESLERDATVYRNLLESMLNHEKEISWQQALEQSDAHIISPAAASDSPTFPPKSLVVLLGTIVGCLISMMGALMRDGIDRTFRQYEDLESATGLPVIALVPNQRNASPASQVLRKPISAYSEALRRIYVGIQMLELERMTKTVLFCSAAPAEGKSMLIASLGRLMASNGKRILVIDCDWRCPNLHRVFRMPNKGGLAALLTDDTVVMEETIRRDTLSGLDVITAGFWDPKDVSALTSERMRLLLEAVSKNYDLVILDAAPILVGAEVLMLSRMVDKVMFTVRWGHTRRDAVFEALRQVIDARGDLAGIILSRVDPKRYRQYAHGPLNYEYTRPVAGQIG